MVLTAAPKPPTDAFASRRILGTDAPALPIRIEHQWRDIALFYANKTADEIAYKDILSEAQTKLGIKVFCTLTNTKAIPRNWPGFVGRIDERVIRAAVPDYKERTFYVSGSLDMVRAYEHILKNMRVRHDQIKKDFFPGLV